MVEILENTENENELECNDANTVNVLNSSDTGNIIKMYITFLLMFQTIFRLSDHSMNVLFAFFCTLLAVLGKTLCSDVLVQFASKLPKNVRLARIVAGGRQHFTEYCCCVRCHSIYPKEECILKDRSGNTSSARCSYVRFPNHPQKNKRLPRGTTLMKQVRSSSGKILLQPYLTYCYNGVIDAIQLLLQRPKFLELCESWRSRQCEKGIYNDVYDAKIWQDFQFYNGEPFLALPYNFALQMNVDWFQPYEHTTHSEGVIFVTVLNLPRNIRYLQEYTLLIGVIPGPKEPKYHINSFLAPFVRDLQTLWSGVVMKMNDGTQWLVRAALLSVSCDIPAARKVCGFCGHGAYHGCSRCLAKFPTKKFGEKPNFDRKSFKTRNNAKHQKWCMQYLQCASRKDQKAIEQKYGVRYSCLVELPYFDCSRMCIVDPMHNLLLGTAKKMMEIWKCNDLINEKNMAVIQECVNTFITPHDIGRLPFKIVSKFSGFTADQWKNWVLFYSLPTLKSILPQDHYFCWHKFVLICWLICRRTISAVDVKRADTVIQEFSELFLNLYGKSYVTPNMHLHHHLALFIEDYGPVYSFWLFPYERLNGVLGSYHTNYHNISVQLMRRFLDYGLYTTYRWPHELIDQFYPIIEKCRSSKGSLKQQIFETSQSCNLIPVPPIYEDGFLPQEYELVLNTIKVIINPCDVLLLHKVVLAIKVDDCLIGSNSSKFQRSSLLLVASKELDIEESLCEVERYLGVSVVQGNNQIETIWIAVVSLYIRHEFHDFFGYPVQVWSLTKRSSLQYILISNIKSRVVGTKMEVKFPNLLNEIVYVITPIQSKFNIIL